MVGLFAFIAFARQRRLDSGIRSGDRNQQYRFSMDRPWASGEDLRQLVQVGPVSSQLEELLT